MNQVILLQHRQQSLHRLRHWLEKDKAVLKEGVQCHRMTQLMLTKIEILQGLKRIANEGSEDRLEADSLGKEKKMIARQWIQKQMT
jgi:hypothetical protein